MNWLEDALERIARSPVCDYATHLSGASEPSALAALALCDHGRAEAAAIVGDYLASLQTAKGCIGVRLKEDWPHWPTSLALLTWLRLDAKKFAHPVQRALDWTLANEGERIENDRHAGHNTRLAAWPWADGTHSWMEPSAFFTIALKAHGLRDHVRTKEAVELLVDRLLPEGGCNYGNTQVLGQTLRPHVQPTGIVMLALADEKDPSGRVERSLDYLMTECKGDLSPHSLCWALLGLAAHGRYLGHTETLLAKAHAKIVALGHSSYSMALLVTAALGTKSSLIQMPKIGTAK
jgi:hypothetical protein